MERELQNQSQEDRLLHSENHSGTPMTGDWEAFLDKEDETTREASHVSEEEAEEAHNGKEIGESNTQREEKNKRETLSKEDYQKVGEWEQQQQVQRMATSEGRKQIMWTTACDDRRNTKSTQDMATEPEEIG